MKKFKYIAIEGPMGAGKTTLAYLLSPMLSAEVILELGKENPFLDLFLENPEKYGVAMQLTYLLSRFHQHAIQIPEVLKSSPVITDCMFQRDYIFASIGLSPNQFAVYHQFYLTLIEQIVFPDVVVYLRGSTNTLVERIKARGQDTYKVWTPQFIDNLRKLYEEFFSSYKTSPVITIDIEKTDYLGSEENVAQLKDAIESI